MAEYGIYQDIAKRSGGDVYVGVVGPVRTGKSTFIKRFMDLIVIPNIENEYKNRFYYFEVKDSSKIAINPDDYKLDKSLKGEFIRTVSQDESLDEETKEKIIACGINALMGEELFD